MACSPRQLINWFSMKSERKRNYYTVTVSSTWFNVPYLPAMTEERTSEAGEEQGITEEKDLAEKLNEVGLEPKKWLPLLKQILGVTNVQVLKHTGPQDYHKIEKKADHPWEKHSLRKLLNADGGQITLSQMQDDRIKRLKENQDGSKKALEELKKMMNEGKTHFSKEILESEKNLCKAMDISKESWPSSNEPLEKVVEKLHMMLNMKDEVLCNATNLPDKGVFLNASCGLALEGIYMTSKQDDVLKKREQIIALPEDIHLTCPQKGPVFEQKEFSSSTAESTFHTTMEKLGYSIAASAKGGFWGFQAEANANYKTSEKSANKSVFHTEQAYFCTTKYNYIPLASCYIPKDKLRLSGAALKDLQTIEELSRHSPLEDKFTLIREQYEKFFIRYGSHANQGTIHFGGIFWWKATSQGFKEDKLEEIKKENSEALNVYAGGSYEGSFSAAASVDVTRTNSKKSSLETKQQTLTKQTQLYVSKTGGPVGVDCHNLWKCGLVASNKTWNVIDRGFCLIPVWEIIIFAHREDFKDVRQVSIDLTKVYEAITNQSQHLLFGENIVTALEEARKFLSDLSSWEVTSAELQLARLIDFKQRLNEITKNYNIWVNVCLPDKGIQRFLGKVIESYKNTQSDVTFIRSQIKCLLQNYECSKENLTAYSFIIKWVYQSEEKQSSVSIKDFSMFINVLSQAKNDLLPASTCLYISEEEISETQIKVNITVLSAINSFLKTLKHTGQTDIELLIITVMSSLGYCLRKKDFQYFLGWQEIRLMEKEIKRLYNEYNNLRELQVYRAQAFVLKAGLTAGDDVRPKSFEQKKELVDYMVKTMNSYLEQDILDVLEKHSESCEFQSLKEDLDLFIADLYGAKIKQKPEEITNRIKNVCQIICPEDISAHTSSDLQEAPEESLRITTNQEFSNLIQSLGLDKYFPKKMSRKKLCIVSKFSVDQLKTEHDLPSCFVQMLMTLDYRFRYLVCKDTSQANIPGNVSYPTQQLNTFDSADDFLNNFQKEDTIQAKSNMHPADILMAMFYCADDFMRQYMFSKLSLCQFALPFLVPLPYEDSIELPLWSLRLVQKSILSAGKDGARSHQEKLICKVENPMACFTRIGKSNLSKSQILNNLLSTSKHDIFYHRNCKGCEKKPILMEGVAEIFWFCPSGKDENQYESCTAFVNLHGDAKEHNQQSDFLLEISTVNILLFSDSEMDKKGKDLLSRMLQSKKPLICLCPDREFAIGTSNSTQVIIGLKNQNEAKILEELSRTLKRLLGLSKKSQSLETCAKIARDCGFFVDEDNSEHAEGKASGTYLLNYIKENDLIKSKEELLPISGHLWHSWCKKDKELSRLANRMKRSIEQHKSEIESEKMAIRRKQLEKTQDNNFMLSFITKLKSLPKPTKMFFLQWFKLFIDDLSCDHIKELQYQYNQLWSHLQTEKSKSENLSSTLLQDMDNLSRKINACMFGLEHVLRELGQTYEVLSELKLNNDNCYTELPKIAADLMASGYPIELMDGDASYLPLKWIRAVFDELIKIIGDKKLFVLSVLGVQSSGKSTLLNTMFGLQFAVSPGRCTRGAFMQLVDIDEDLKKDLGFDFILVIDTEGLRSMELVNQSNQNHDNELATFVIGVGNMTLINVFGENPSEIKDILQIAVQAFLRMKQIKLSPSCVFVHQNVSEMSASEKNLEGRIHLEKELDKITSLAAEQEFCNVQRFRDVIRFDAEKHILYFAHLWLGNPPMAPPNPAYTQNAQELRNIILQAGGTEAKSLLSISELKVRIEDLWLALKNENFVFSFRNTLEISAYSKVENRYNHWTWQLRRHVLELQIKLSNKIKKGEISKLERKDVQEMVQEKFVDIDKELKIFFNEDKDKEILVQWRENVKKRLKNLLIELVEETKRQGQDLIRLKKSQSKVKQKQTDYEEELFKKSKQVALTIKNEDLKEEDLREHFITLWQSWVMEIKSSLPPVEKPNLIRDAEAIIWDYFQNEPGIADKLRDVSKWKLFSIDFGKHISMKRRFLLEKSLTQHDKYFIQNVVDNLKKEITEYLEKKHQNNVDYNEGFFHEIINIVLDDGNLKSESNNFTFTKTLKVDLSLYLFHMAIPSFDELQHVFHIMNDPLEVLESRQEEFFNCFKISCEGATSVTTFANYLCSKLIDDVCSAVYNRTALAVVDEMSCNFPAFSGNRSKLETYILIHLAEHEDFEKYRQYLHFPEQFFESYIEECVHGYCLNQSSPRLNNLINISVDHYHNLLLLAISESTQLATDKGSNVSGWLDEFYKRVEDIVSFSRGELRSIEHQEIRDIEFIKEAMSKAWDVAMDTLKTKLDRSSFDCFETKPSNILVKQLCGCWEQCPFCKAICTNTIPGHDGDHSVPFHRSQAISGIPWINSNEFVTEICSTLVSSDACAVISDTKEIPYKDYRKIGPNYEKWSITPDTSAQPYWKWFVSFFRTNLENDYGCRFVGKGAIPPQWEAITKDEVIDMLKEQIGTN
ncbi:interferon-induced very large GTPase 1-like [Pelobates cultripes]|uniref:Interferon-induced very large GTPase 1-like n=1 Tax=Pelobates cultripes TaxID=61616 RepID=A0AAD1TM66_PELCU|nr:interferon-induced very large GTPase 1-like [Pelobates cultripes]